MNNTSPRKFGRLKRSVRTETNSRRLNRRKSVDFSELNLSSELMKLENSPEYYIRNRGLLKHEYEHARLVYENNHDYYYHKGDYTKLNGLEHWFIHVIEPLGDDSSGWFERESTKIFGYTYHCYDRAKPFLRLSKLDTQKALFDLQVSTIIYKNLVKKKKICDRSKC